MKKESRSGCFLSLALEVFGDKWTLLIIRDMMLGDKRHFRDILKSEEKISTNILAQRLSFLEQQGVVGKRSDASHKQKVLYHLTQKGIDLLPVIVSIAEWSIKYEPVSSESATQARVFLDGGAPMVKKWMSDLKEKHLQA